MAFRAAPFWGNSETAVMDTTIIKASITAYSTAVAAAFCGIAGVRTKTHTAATSHGPNQLVFRILVISIMCAPFPFFLRTDHAPSGRWAARTLRAENRHVLAVA